MLQYGNMARGSAVLRVLGLGHSKGRGNSSAAGDDPRGTLTQWDAANSRIVTVGASDVLEATVGSYWPAFATAFFSATNRRVQLCNNGIGGSGYRYDLDANLSWYTTGNLWAASVTKARNWLNHVGAVDPDLVILHLGVSDANKAPVTTTYADMTNLIDRINTEYNSPRIMIIQEATNSAIFLTTWQLLFNLAQFQKWQKQLSFDYANVEIGPHEGYLNQWLTAALVYQGDGVHLTKLGNDFLGSRIARQAALGNRIDKPARHWIGGDYFNPTGQRKEWFNELSVDLNAAGILAMLDGLHITSNEGSLDTANRYKNSTKDLAYISPGGPTAAAMTLFDGNLANGTTEQWVEGIYSIMENKANFASDFFVGVYLVDNLDPAGTLNALFGTRENAATGIVYLGQNASNQIEFCACDGVVDVDATETSFQDGNWYFVARSAATGSNNKHFIKNTTVHSFSRNSIGLGPAGNIRASRYQSYNNNGTVSNHGNNKIAVTVVGKYNGFPLSTFITIMNAFLAKHLTNV